MESTDKNKLESDISVTLCGPKDPHITSFSFKGPNPPLSILNESISMKRIFCFMIRNH